MNYKLYPPNWKTEIRPRILARARRCCEFCGVPDRVWRGKSLVILTIAHLDQDRTNNADSNLAALCQRCHINHDKWFQVRHRRQNRIRRLEEHGQQRLF
jgi:5-methylcytosine-specific restriction endonuclease McrA